MIARLGPDDKIPAQERLLTAGSVCFALLQAAQAMGYGAQWLTGWAAYDPEIRTLLGVGEDEVVAGFIHIGTAQGEVPERDRPDPAALLAVYVGLPVAFKLAAAALWALPRHRKEIAA